MALVNLDSASVSLDLPKLPKEMISVVKLDDGRTKVRINSSSLDVIQTCMRKAQYSLLEGWKAENESPATLFGSAIHAALEVFYKRPPGDRKLAKLETMEMMSYGNRVPGEEEDLILSATRAFIDKAQALSPLPPEDKRSIQNGVWILREYFKTFLEDPYVAYVDESGPFLERKFTLSIYEDSEIVIETFGTIDFVFQHSVTKELLPGDFKTASFLNFGGSSYFDRERPNSQYCLYLHAVREVFKLPVSDFMIQVVEVKGKPVRATSKGVSFPRQVTTRTDNDFAELKEVLVYESRRYLRAIEKNVWPIGPVGSCNAYGSCGFRQVCAAPKELRETIMQNKFKRVADA